MTGYNWPTALVLLVLLGFMLNLVVYLLLTAAVGLGRAQAACRSTGVPAEVSQLERRVRQVWRGSAVGAGGAAVMFAVVVTASDGWGWWSLVGPWMPPLLLAAFVVAAVADVRAFRRRATGPEAGA
ncbi:hypothetical protein AB0M43_37780 [Longispora sp. NPDC051575]|uniref:hypothetical protein n=1 Tax=Longispora sp. NPDC051575 TaxID=3154943 RepID=UPI003445F9A1